MKVAPFHPAKFGPAVTHQSSGGSQRSRSIQSFSSPRRETQVEWWIVEKLTAWHAQLASSAVKQDFMQYIPLPTYGLKKNLEAQGFADQKFGSLSCKERRVPWRVRTITTTTTSCTLRSAGTTGSPSNWRGRGGLSCVWTWTDATTFVGERAKAGGSETMGAPGNGGAFLFRPARLASEKT